MGRRPLAALLALVWLGVGGGMAAPVGEAFRVGRVVEIAARPITVAAERLAGLTPLGAWHLSARDPDFGGISGLVVARDGLAAVTDRGFWILARPGGPEAPFARARILPMRGLDDAAFDKTGGDAEGLARAGNGLWVSFERDHRIMAHLGEGFMVPGPRHGGWADLAFNGGLEALSPLPGGGMLAIAETPAEDGFPMFRIGAQGRVEAVGRLAQLSPELVTGADLGPDGRLYVVFRHWSRETGTRIRLRRYPLGGDGWPDQARVEELGVWGPESGIDNIETVALWRDGAGRDRLWLVSDDNFNAPAQRTMLLDFALAR